ncbi:MAG: SPFH domain-containing protein [archaeon]
MDEKKVKSAIFSILLIIVITIVSILLFRKDVISEIFFWIIIGCIGIYVIFKAQIVLQLKEYERAVVFRFGRVNRVGGPGWTVILPFIEKPVLVSLRAEVIDVPPQLVLTKDNVQVTIDAIVYLYVKSDKDSVINSVIKVKDYKEAATLFVIGKLRDLLGGFILTDVVTNIEKLNTELMAALIEITKEWGVAVQDVEIKEVIIPEDIIKAMHAQKAAVQKKLAIYEEAEGEKAKILAVKEATDIMSDKTVIYYYIRALEKMADGQASKIIFPMELTSLLEKITDNIGHTRIGPNISANPASLTGKIEKGVDTQALEKYLPLIKKYIDDSNKGRFR